MPDSDARRFEMLEMYCRGACIAVVVLGCADLWGWAFNIGLLTTVVPGLVTMKPNAAAGLMLSAISLWLLLPGVTRPRRVHAAQFLALVVTLLGIATLSQYLFSVNLGIDQLLFKDLNVSVGTTAPGRMAPTTATALLAIGLALLLLDWKTRRGRWLSQAFSLGSGLIALTAFNGYVYNAVASTRIFLFTQVAINTTFCLLLLSAALLFARPRTGISNDLTAKGSGSVMARRLLPAILVVPISLGWILLREQKGGWYGSEVGLALYATSSVVVLAALVWVSARKMNEEYEQRSLAESSIRELNAELEERVAERTKTLEQQARMLTEQAGLLDLAPDAIIVRDMQSRISFWSRGAQVMYGWRIDEALGKNCAQLLETKLAEPTSLVDGGLLDRGEWEGEVVERKSDGTRLTVSSRSTFQRDATGSPVRILTVNNDITTRKQSEEVLRQSNEKLRMLVLGVKDYAILMLDPEGRITTWNEGAERIKGYRAEEIIGEHFSKFYTAEAVAQGHPEDELKIASEQGRFEEEGWRVRKDGSKFWANVVITALRDQAGQLRGYAKVTRDITDHMLAESRLRLLTERLSLATAIAKVGVWEWDIDANLLIWDAVMLEIYGFPAGTSNPMPYTKWSAMVHSEDLPAVEEILRRTIAGKEDGTAEFRIIRADGSRRTISAVERVVFDERLQVSRMIGVNVDITDRKEAAEVLEESRKRQLQFKDQFLSHVSHELRAPLTAIMQFTTILLDGLGGDLGETQREYEQIVLNNARQLQAMINDLLEVTRLEAGKLTADPTGVFVADVVSDTLNTLLETAREKGINVSSVLPHAPLAVYADETRLRQILIILVDNALKFTAGGGKVTIQVQLQPQVPEFVLLEVSDTGSGMTQETADRVFERLYQETGPIRANNKGLGLGLFICKELVELQGGQIWVKSELKKGSTFSFTVPVLSLERLITPLVKDGFWPAESAYLVIVRISVPDALPLKSQEEWHREVRRVIRHCLMPDRDVVLSKMSHEGDGERVLVAAFADEKGVSVLGIRIQEQLERLAAAKMASVTLSVSHSKLKPFSRNDASVDEIVREMARNLQEAINAHRIPAPGAPPEIVLPPKKTAQA